jgi:hypothetical protein
MIRGLTGVLAATAERGLRDFLLGIVAATVAALFAAISLGFGTFAAYVYPRASEGRGNVDSLLQDFAAAGTARDQRALVAALRLGRELSPAQLVALALVGGFIAGRRIRKSGFALSSRSGGPS